jgi:hypothetical protein
MSAREPDSAESQRPHDPPLDRGEEGAPYLKLPNGGYRIPQASLLASLNGIYDLEAECAAFDERFANVTEEQVRAAMAASE